MSGNSPNPTRSDELIVNELRAMRVLLEELAEAVA